jgi:hypothetical protein
MYQKNAKESEENFYERKLKKTAATTQIEARDDIFPV